MKTDLPTSSVQELYRIMSHKNYFSIGIFVTGKSNSKVYHCSSFYLMLTPWRAVFPSHLKHATLVLALKWLRGQGIPYFWWQEETTTGARTTDRKRMCRGTACTLLPKQEVAAG